ncbi:MAG TPA: hypothetical protein PKA88_16680 [Polyangiaceae bacterium]|nr:hypothetical protein [Polyangiaceae bacterium]
MYERVTTALMLAVAIIHLLPSVGFLGTTRLATLYAIEVTGPDLEILLRHRALLFGILGAFFGYAAFVPALQPIAFCGAGLSIGSFFYLAWAVGGYGSALTKVVVVDVIAAACLAGATLSYLVKPSG